MYYRITRFNYQPNQLDAAMKWVDSMKPRFSGMGAVHMHWVEFGPGEGGIVALYPSKEAADAVSAKASDNFREAAERGYVDAATVQRIEGEVINSVGAQH